ncbi:MAG: hypothetical protein TEF_10225 [Rhizobiales bacterium NRL2]|nr:MAG: hypothetical protein TEF_10225 [Rhizobiales bacterium NRL2]
MPVQNYMSLTRLIERMHRRFLDVLRKELIAEGVRDINGVQYLMLANIGDDEIMVRELVERGYYLGSNVTYNVKKLLDFGYVDQRGSELDKRVIMVSVSDKGRRLLERMQRREHLHAGAFADMHSIEQMRGAVETLRRLERVWDDVVAEVHAA